MKKCSKCLIEKDFSFFNKASANKDGLQSFCKICNSDSNKKHYLSNKDKKSTSSKEWRENNPDYMKNYHQDNREKMLELSKEYYNNNREKMLELANDYYKENKDSILDYKKQFYIENKDSILDHKKIYYIENKDSRKEYNKLYYEKHRDKLINNRVKWLQNKLDTDSVFKFKHRTRTTVSEAFKRKGYSKRNKTEFILGCSLDCFKDYIESKFESWMNWENYGKYNGELNYGWDIDHIIPISLATTEEEVMKLNYYTNLQPLCSYTNRYIKRNTNPL